MKNILFLHAGSELYGADIILYNLVKNIDKNKFTVYVVLPNYGPLVEKIRGENIFCEVIEYPILRRKYFSLKGIMYFMTNYKKKCDEIMELFKSNDITIDIIHNNTFAVLEGIYLKYKLNTKLITHVHEIIKKPKWLSIFLSKIFALFSDSIVCVSEAVANEIKQNVRSFDKINVVYNGIDNSVFHSNYSLSNVRNEFGLSKDNIVVGMIGRINSWKGQDDFLDAITPLLIKYPNLYALIVGGVFEGEEWRYDKLRERINHINTLCNNRIIFSNFRKDNYLIHNLIDIYVLPSTNPDPLPTVILESMACGKPIVGYRHGGVCEMVEDGINGILVEPNQPKELSVAIEELILNEEKRMVMSEKSFIREINMFSINKQIKLFEHLYNK